MGEIPKYFATKVIGRAGSSQMIYLDKNWKLKKHEVVNLTIRKADMSDKPFKCAKKICKAGGSWVIYCSNLWHYEVGEFVTLMIERRETPPEGAQECPVEEVPDDKCVREIVDDIGIEDKEED